MIWTPPRSLIKSNNSTTLAILDNKLNLSNAVLRYTYIHKYIYTGVHIGKLDRQINGHQAARNADVQARMSDIQNTLSWI